MGSKCGPSIANAYLYIFEKKWLSIEKPLFYKRFIDDIFLVTNNSIHVNTLKSSFLNLNLNIVSDKSVNFLDLKISLDNLSGKLKYCVFLKKTKTFSYLNTISNHKSSIFKNIPKSLFIRIRRNCSNFTDYVYFSGILTDQLQNRGYELKHLNKVFTMVANLKQRDLVQYKQKKKFGSENDIFFKSSFDRNLLNVNQIIKISFDNFKIDKDYLNNNSYYNNNNTKF